MSRGLLYIATGRQHVAEAARSVASFKAQMPHLPAVLYTDVASDPSPDAPFDAVHHLDSPSLTHADKILALKRTPFEQTLFLDSDTHCLAPCEELFEILDRYDYAAAHAPVRACWDGVPCPDSFPELNTGVILFNSNPRFNALVDDWFTIYTRCQQLPEPPPHDQPAFREAAFRSPASLYVLPPEYNLRSCFSAFVGGNARVKIVHDRGMSLVDFLGALEDSGDTSPIPRTFAKKVEGNEHAPAPHPTRPAVHAP